MLHVLPFARDPKDPNDLVDTKAPEAATRNKKNIPSCIAKGNAYNRLKALYNAGICIKAIHIILPDQDNTDRPP